VKSKINFQTKKEYGTTLGELKTFGRPNLDDGNRFFDDNKLLYQMYAPIETTEQLREYLDVRKEVKEL